MSDFDPARRNEHTRALIFGGTQGLGFAIAEQLIREGCRHIAIAGRGREAGEKAAQSLSAKSADCIFVQADLADVSQCRNAVEKSGKRFGALNGLVNAAANTARGGLLDTEPEFFDEMFATNARGPFFTMQAFARHCIECGHDGRIVNILSIARHCGQSFLAPYSASKQALATLTKNAAAALAKHRIRVNGIAPGWMDTPGEDAVQRRHHDADDDWLEKAEAAQPFGQLIKPEEVAGLAAYLLGPQSGVMTGAIIDHDQNVIGDWKE